MTPTIADIPWPGPRPLSFATVDAAVDPTKVLVGREREMNELLDVCRTYAVVEITAASGVGKTSFVAGAKPHLEEAGAKVVKARPWSASLAEYDAMGDAIAAPLDPLPLYCVALGIEPVKKAAELRDALLGLGDEQPVVCVFDQLEELLRYRRLLGRNLLELIGTTAATSNVPHVVVARSEYRNDLHPVEVTRAPTWHLRLDELVEPEVIARIIKSPVPDGVTIESDVTERIVAWWESARGESQRQRMVDGRYQQAVGECGLLHLQALLWSLQRWASTCDEVDQSRLTLADLGRYAGEQGLEPGPDWGGLLMADALRTYVEDAVAECIGTDWTLGPQVMLARVAGHLSSAGFKLPQPTASLVSWAMQEELGSSKSGPGRSLVESVGQDGKDGDLIEELAERFQIEGAGVAHGWDGSDVVRAMISCLELALDRLAREGGPNILRRYEHSGITINELVHDGVAPAMIEWSDSFLERPLATLGGIVARRGEIFSEDLRPDVFLEGGEVKPGWDAVRVSEVSGRRAARIDAVKWHGMGIHRPDPETGEPMVIEGLVFEQAILVGTLFNGVVFRDVVFHDCAMRGIAMMRCRFENVAFESCDLVGAAFNRCGFDGVRFDAAERSAGTMNYVSIEHPEPGATVELSNIEETTGLFLVGLSGGDWTLDNVEISHFSFESGERDPVSLRAHRSSLRQVTVDVPPGLSTVELPDGVVVEQA